MKRSMCAVLFFAQGAFAGGPGRIIVCHDEWPLSDSGFGIAPNAEVFAANIAEFFGTGDYLAVSTNFGLIGVEVEAAMIDAGCTWTVFDFEPALEAMLAFDAVFTGGPPTIDPQKMIDYVNAGGNVYLMGGTGVGGGAPGEAAAWNPFLNAFGLEFEPFYNQIEGRLDMGGHVLFFNVDTLYHDNGSSILDLDPNDNAQIIFDFNGAGLFATVQEGCTADCNADGTLNILDFVCFQSAWQNQTAIGDCDANGVYNILDFVCYQGVFSAGCR